MSGKTLVVEIKPKLIFESKNKPFKGQGMTHISTNDNQLNLGSKKKLNELIRVIKVQSELIGHIR